MLKFMFFRKKIVFFIYFKCISSKKYLQKRQMLGDYVHVFKYFEVDFLEYIAKK